MNSFFRNIKLEGDKIIWIIVFALCSLSVLVVYSVAGWNFFFNHLIKVIIGLICMYIIHKWKFKYFSRIGFFGFWISIGLLILVFLFGVNINEASRWLSFGGQQFQPSDIARLAVLLFLSRQLSKKRDKINNFQGVFLHLLLPLLTICILILPNNFSTAALVFLSGFTLMYIGMVKLKYLFTIAISGLFTLMIIYITAHSPFMKKIIPRSTTWVNRVKSFSSSNSSDILDKNYQITHALIAIHNGGIIGVGQKVLKETYSHILILILYLLL